MTSPSRYNLYTDGTAQNYLAGVTARKFPPRNRGFFEFVRGFFRLLLSCVFFAVFWADEQLERLTNKDT